jgi:hypothetical protein
MPVIDLLGAIDELRRWTEFWQIYGALRKEPQPTWIHGDKVIEAARRFWTAQGGKLQELWAESNVRLAPLEDPLFVDLGLHRWLSNEREEAYSDWLEWVVKQLPGLDSFQYREYRCWFSTPRTPAVH